MSVVAIVGAGMMGSAMSFPLADNHHQVRLVGTPLDRHIIDSVAESGYHPTLKRQLPLGVEAYQFEELGQALAGADLLIGGVSSFGIEWFASEVLPLAAKFQLPILMVTKGLAEGEDGELVSFPDWLSRHLSDSNVTISAIGGPCTSHELADRRHSLVTFCGYSPTVLQWLKELLQTAYYHINLSTDVMGVESAVALKNAYALGVTLAVGEIEKEEGVGCTPAYNPQAALFGQSIYEMNSLVQLLGGQERSVRVGISDLYVTIFGGRTRKLGTLLGRGYSFAEAIAELGDITLESVAITKRIVSSLRKREARGELQLRDYPLLSHIAEIISGESKVNIPWTSFMRHDFL